MLLWPTVPAASSAAFGFPWFLPLAGRFWQGPRQIILAAVCVFGMRLVVWGGGVAQAVSTESRGGGGDTLVIELPEFLSLLSVTWMFLNVRSYT